MKFTIEFFHSSALGASVGRRLGPFSSRRAALEVAEHRRPGEADGFRLYGDGALLRVGRFRSHRDAAAGQPLDG